MTLSRTEKTFVIAMVIAIIVVWILALPEMGGMTDLSDAGIGTRWVYTFPGSEGSFFTRINFLTVGVGLLITLFLIGVARGIRKTFSLVPNRKQSLVEYLLQFFYDLTGEAINDKRYVKPVFVIAMTLFLFIAASNILSGIPGINVSIRNQETYLTFFTDTWYVPTSDLNTNGTYALIVLVISHIFGIKAKGFKAWAKSFFEPIAIMFPMNVIGELAKPVSHSCRLFGNIFGGGILVFILSYILKFLFLPMFFWGFFGMFFGLIQALIFSVLTIVYIGSQVN
ncbi:MAG TPA: F0F1 ATP synthase subunit A [Thermotogota bacterium]|jgi:F-type H+-transporting ATPase subunit a|nr:MAG: ATP synthase subunit a [Thermotogota bacterium ADurb.Bin062]HNW45781.1 F0F1 ATP synthase subunit A [Thermotogota bacterium]HNY81306.1 F0F1 ATP synthase subunit A [Thermotogota bacterium]HOD90526.1 F0F1 ATP synthase subunit A [Thermotogota bacterium]HOF23287.1 F0F1 ATP synthase subunit A [Thermotogota bacterium]